MHTRSITYVELKHDIMQTWTDIMRTTDMKYHAEIKYRADMDYHAGIDHHADIECHEYRTVQCTYMGCHADLEYYLDTSSLLVSK